VGVDEGVSVGAWDIVGDEEGFAEGTAVSGRFDGFIDGASDGESVGDAVGFIVGDLVGAGVTGAKVGTDVTGAVVSVVFNRRRPWYSFAAARGDKLLRARTHVATHRFRKGLILSLVLVIC
jgi:hypothetical protein